MTTYVKLFQSLLDLRLFACQRVAHHSHNPVVACEELVFVYMGALGPEDSVRADMVQSGEFLHDAGNRILDREWREGIGKDGRDVPDGRADAFDASPFAIVPR